MADDLVKRLGFPMPEGVDEVTLPVWAIDLMSEARDRIEALEREVETLATAASQDAEAAEAALATARADALREAEKAILPGGDIAWRGSWYEPALRAAQSRVRALIDGGRT